MQRVGNTSWLKTENQVIKLCDNTVFNESSTIIPQGDIKNFFCEDELKPGEKIEININFNNEIYKFNLSRDPEVNRTKLSWGKTSVKKYLNKFKDSTRFERSLERIDINDYTRMEFTKNEDGVIKLEVINKSNSNNFIFEKK